MIPVDGSNGFVSNAVGPQEAVYESAISKILSSVTF
jgi:hypothetical protein